MPAWAGGLWLRLFGCRLSRGDRAAELGPVGGQAGSVVGGVGLVGADQLADGFFDRILFFGVRFGASRSSRLGPQVERRPGVAEVLE